MMEATKEQKEKGGRKTNLKNYKEETQTKNKATQVHY